MFDYLGYRGKRVVVSGCFSGMGEAAAGLLLQAGAEVHGFDFKESKLKLATFQQVDLRERAAIDAGVKNLGGEVDALFNCAGLSHVFPALDVIKVNYIGTRHLTEQILPLMSEGGAIVSISSLAGIGWSRRLPLLKQILAICGFERSVEWCEANMDVVADGYALSKELIAAWTMLWSSTLIKSGVRMNCIMPGPTQTPMMQHIESGTSKAVLDASMQPINRRAAPYEQAGPLLFLNSVAASYVNGVCLPVDGGFMAGASTGQIDMSRLVEKSPASPE